MLYRVKEQCTLFWPTHFIGWPESMGITYGAARWRDRNMVPFAGPGDVVDLSRRVDRLVCADQMSRLVPLEDGEKADPIKVEPAELAARIEADPLAVLRGNGLVSAPQRRSHDTLGFWLRKRGLELEDLEPKAAKPKRGPGRPKKEKPE